MHLMNNEKARDLRNVNVSEEETLYHPRNTELGKYRLTIEYLFFLFIIGRWYYEKKVLF